MKPIENLNTDDLAFWYGYRAEQIENRTGLIENGLVMLQWAVDKFVPYELIQRKNRELHISFEELREFVYTWGIDKTISLDGFKTMSRRAKLDIYVARMEEINDDISAEEQLERLVQLVQKLLAAEEAEEEGRRIEIIKDVITCNGVWFGDVATRRKIVTDEAEILTLTLFVAYFDGPVATSLITSMIKKGGVLL